MTIKKQHTKAYVTFVERYKEVSRDIPIYNYNYNFGALRDAEKQRKNIIAKAKKILSATEFKEFSNWQIGFDELAEL